MKRKKLLVALAAVTVVAIAAIGAYAYWTQGGSGTGSAATDTTTPVTVNQTSTITGLYPGGSAQPLSGDFDNPNASPVKVGSVTAIVLDTTNPGCTSADFTIGGTAAVDAVIPSGNGVGSWSGLTIQMDDTGVNQNACKNVTVHLSYSVSAGA